MGLLFGLVLSVGFVVSTADHSLWSGTSVGTAYLYVLIMVFGAAAIGIVFAKTIGMASMFAMVGAFVAGIIALFDGQAGYSIPMFILAIGLFVVQKFCGAIVEAGEMRRQSHYLERIQFVESSEISEDTDPDEEIGK